MAKDVTIVGPLNIDMIMIGEGPANWQDLPIWDGPADIEMAVAGSIGYTTGDLARLGLDVRVSSCVPDDSMGAFILESLKRSEVDISMVKSVPDTKAGIGVYMLLFGNRKRPLAYRMPTHPAWPKKYNENEIDSLLDAKLLHCGGYLHFKDMWHGATIEVYKEAKKKGLITSMDSQFPLFAMDPPWMTAMLDILPSVDLFFCDEVEAAKLTGEKTLDDCARVLLDQGIETVVIKQGAEGSTIFHGDSNFHQEAIKQGELVDSIGAGDAYDACFIYGTLQGWSLGKRALFASLGAGHTVTAVGGTTSFPSLERILQKK